MKYVKYLMIIVILPIALNAVAPFIQPRSQSEYSNRDLVGLTRYINLYDQECVYGCWAITPEYMSTTQPKHIDFTLFGSDIMLNAKYPFIQVSGTQSGDRNVTDWLADYFGLPPDYKSQLLFKPNVQNILADFAFYIGLDQWMDGLYFRIHAPVVKSRWDLNFREVNINSGILGYNAGYFAPTAQTRSQLVSTFTAFANGAVPDLGAGIIFTPLQYAKIPTRRLSKTRLSDIQFAFGWNFLQGDDHHFGLNIRGAAPTGNRPTGEFLFEPLVGNGHHWELGLGVTSHYLLVVDPCKCRTVGFYFDANLTHLFTAHQKRTFDLIDKPMSRYMLIERMGIPVSNLFISTTQGTAMGAVAPSTQFQDIYTPLANFSTFDVNVTIAAQIDVTAMIDISWGAWDINFGYNFWARTCEKIKPACQCTPLLDGSLQFALQGDAYMIGFVATDSTVLAGQPIPLSATESKADIHSGTNTPVGTAFNISQTQNPGIDGGVNQWAFVDPTNNTDQIMRAPGLPSDLSGTNAAGTQQRSTLAPILIAPTDIDFEAAETKGLSNSLFVHFNYNWDRCRCWQAYCGVGAFVEWAHHSRNGACQEPDTDGSCTSCAFSQWGAWIKGGFAF